MLLTLLGNNFMFTNGKSAYWKLFFYNLQEEELRKEAEAKKKKDQPELPKHHDEVKREIKKIERKSAPKKPVSEAPRAYRVPLFVAGQREVPPLDIFQLVASSSSSVLKGVELAARQSTAKVIMLDKERAIRRRRRDEEAILLLAA